MKSDDFSKNSLLHRIFTALFYPFLLLSSGGKLQNNFYNLVRIDCPNINLSLKSRNIREQKT